MEKFLNLSKKTSKENNILKIYRDCYKSNIEFLNIYDQIIELDDFVKYKISK